MNVCMWCGGEIGGGPKDWCPRCILEIQNRPDPAGMTPDERVAEIDWFYAGPGSAAMVPFHLMHERIEALCGGPVWTHKLGDRDRIREMVCTHARLASPLDRLPDEGTIVLVV